MNALSIDVEDYFHVTALSKVIRPEDWDNLEHRFTQNTKKILEIFAEHNTKATFFVLGWVAKRNPHIVKEIVENGHELACHGMNHQLIYNQSREIFERETTDSKKLLEDISGTEVRGYRAASYSITNQSKWALDVLVNAGFIYDSSLFPIKHDVYGYSTRSKQPHRLSTENGAEIIEYPLSVYEIGKLTIPVAGGGYFRLYPYWLTRFFISRLEKKGKSTVFYLHPWEVDPEQPRILGLSWKSRFRHYNNLEKCEARLRNLLQDFSYLSMYDCLAKLELV